MAQLLNGHEIVTPTDADSTIAKESSQRLAAYLVQPEELHFEVKLGTRSEELVLPPSALRLLLRVLTEMGRGNAVSLTPLHAELTSQQAADLLNVSCPHLVKLLDEGAIPSRKVGSHRRVLLQDVLSYRRDFQARRQAALEELAGLSQDLGTGC